MPRELVVQFSPPRLNLAGVCVYCLRWRCDSPQCIAHHQQFWWAPCPDCMGGLDDEQGNCDCLSGVREYDRADAEQLVTQFFAELANRGVHGVPLRAVA